MYNCKAKTRYKGQKGHKALLQVGRAKIIAPVKQGPGLFWLKSLLALLFALVALGLAYQLQPYSFRLDIGTPADNTYVARFYPEEHNPDFDYRWSRRESYINLYYPGTPYELDFRAVAARPDGQPVEVEIIANGQSLGQVKLDGTPQVYSVHGNKPLIWGPEELALTFRSAQIFAEPGGRDQLGFALDWIEVRAAKSKFFGLIVPPPFVLVWWLLLIGLGAALVWYAGLPRWSGWLVSGLTLTGICLCYALPEQSRLLHTDWLLTGLQFGLGELVLVIGLLFWLKPSPKKSARPEFLQSPALVLFCGLLLLYLATARGHMGYGDDVVMEAATANIAAGKPADPLNQWLSIPLKDGVVHSKYGIGQSLLAAPFYAVASRAARALPFMLADPVGERGLITYIVLWVSALETALGGVALYWVVRLLSYRRWIAFVTGALLGVTTLVWHYARTFLSEPLVMLCLTVALGATLAYNKEKRLGWAVLIGFSLGLAVATRTFNLAIVPFFVLYLLLDWWSSGPKLKPGIKLLVTWSAPFAAWLALVLWWNWARFGTPFETGYGGELQSFDTPLLKGFYGQLFSPGKSLFLYNPVLVLAVAGLPFVWRSRLKREITLLALLVSLVYVLLYSMWHDWQGGGVWGPRFLVPLLPLLLLPVAGLIEGLAESWQGKRPGVAGYCLTVLALLTVGLSFLVQLLGIVINYQIYATVYKDEAVFQQVVFNPPASPLLKHLELWQAGERPDFAPRFYHDTPFARLTGVWQSAFWLLFLGVLLFGGLNLLQLYLSKRLKPTRL